MWSTGAGSEVMQRIAAPMIGGMISSTSATDTPTSTSLVCKAGLMQRRANGLRPPSSGPDQRTQHPEAVLA
jgi:hypothetical protein